MMTMTATKYLHISLVLCAENRIPPYSKSNDSCDYGRNEHVDVEEED